MGYQGTQVLPETGSMFYIIGALVVVAIVIVVYGILKNKKQSK
ncbi:MAG: hypothetical protein UT66_C0002G0031 [candidate division CPR2 bacterium GW2011_GWC1_39_9]|uniref:Uncharacterized protein n=1 Tax=candidate division CPR2 bacterium GW2011_GWC2_39_10 TaxID=1618345 RepID=A0A0G0P984_UNCC2|nr:MAG: hypothetical protein UT18_C0009G0090 [candidate division CPR2 bacterium GW2011_GWC2_39_10]KKR36153.1 MAG: hypothetical protein UT66_C0002G0031 [candidate division CPR2 bacterium GW2011_GWC1_39_9]